MGDKKIYMFLLLILIISAKLRIQENVDAVDVHNEDSDDDDVNVVIEEEPEAEVDTVLPDAGHEALIIDESETDLGEKCTQLTCTEETKDTACGSECNCDILHPPNGICMTNINPDPNNVCSKPTCSQNDYDCGPDCLCITKDGANGVCWAYTTKFHSFTDLIG